MSFSITSRSFGVLPTGQTVEAWTLRSTEGLQADILTFGAIVRSLCIPTANGIPIDVVLGFDSLDAYLSDTSYFGATVGRVAGRTPGGRIDINGIIYQLPQNDVTNHLHGGFTGFSKKLWTAVPLITESSAELQLTCVSPDGEEGYPGNISVALTFALSKDALTIRSEVKADEPTPVSLTHHSYFNLGGEASGSATEHTIQIFAKEVVQTDENMTPLGKLVPVDSKNDLRLPRKLTDILPGLQRLHGDLYRLPIRNSDSLYHAARLAHSATGIEMNVFTDEAYLQLYTGVHLDGTITGKNGTRYIQHAGICFECEGYPDGTKHPQLGDIVVLPRETQRRTTSFRFRAVKISEASTDHGALHFVPSYEPAMPQRKDFRIGILGSGFIVRDCHLVSYRRSGFNPVAIASRDSQNAGRVAAEHGIPKVYDSYTQLLDDETIEVLDIAVPPMHQLALIREACERRSVKGILAQKPLALTYADAVQAVELCESAGITLSVNQNMRFDPTVHTFKRLIEDGFCGGPVFATIDMRAIPHWKPWQALTGSATMKIMSVHHLDCMRYWFGEPDHVFCSTRTDPRTAFKHSDGICTTILEYDRGLRCVIVDDVWTGPAREGAPEDIGITWRVEGTEGLAIGDIGWCKNPYTTPSTMRYARKGDSDFHYFAPTKSWFPDAFSGTMGQLLVSLETGNKPELTGRDNLRTIALVEAALLSASEHRVISRSEFQSEVKA